MKIVSTLLAALIVFCASGANAQTNCKQTPQEVAKAFAKAFEAKRLGSLDPGRNPAGRIKLTMENSLVDDGAKGQFAVKTFPSFNAFEKWLAKREIDGLPNRAANALINCRNGICSFKINGLLHKTLYLKRVSLGFTKAKCPYIKSVYIVDGN